MGKRSNILVVLGLAFFVLGAGIVFLLVGDGDGDDDGNAVGNRETQVLVARRPIPAGTSGADVVAQQLVEAREVEPAQVAPGALTSVDALAGRTIGSDVAVGAQVTSAALRPPQVRGSVIVIPEGKQGVAVQLDFVPGVAGYVGAGDRINVYSVVRSAPEGPRAKLVLSNVEVLDVSQEVAPRRAAENQQQERTTGNAITYLLALDPDEAERVIFLTSMEQLYLALARTGAPPVATGGQGYETVLR